MNLRICAAHIWVGIFVAALASPTAMGVELITNGGFESGDFTGWTIADFAGGSGSWFAELDAIASTPLSSMPTVGAATGDYYAVSDQTGPGTHVLQQSFTIPSPAASVVLSFDMFVNDSDGGPIVSALGLDHTGEANQHARVDLMTASAGDFDTGAGVIQNFYTGVDPQALNPNPYTSYQFDITNFVTAGETYKIRFGEVDNQLFLNQGVDNVSVTFTPVPEPTTFVLSIMAAFAMPRRR